MADAPGPLRFASPEDAATLAALLREFNAEYNSPTPPAAVLEERYRSHLAGDAFWAVLTGTPPHAFATVSLRPSVYHPGPVALIEDLYVRPAQRGHGIGAQIMTAIQERARADGCGALEVQVDEPDVDAMRFYERHGFALREPLTQDRALLMWLEYGT